MHKPLDHSPAESGQRLHAVQPSQAAIDVDQLLRDIGQASTNTSPVELFRLCLDAQRLLAGAQPGRASATVASEAALLANFRALDNYGRDAVVGFSRQLLAPFARQRSPLALVHPPQNGGTV